jgi:tetratricopeptide (TPR) repeat protein
VTTRCRFHQLGLGRRSPALVLALALVGPLAAASAVHATTTPACDQACDRFDKEIGDRSDDQALAAAKALDKPCAGDARAQARALSRQSIVYFYRKDIDQAETLAKRAVALNPADGALHLTYCGVLTESGRYAQAVQACQDGLVVARKADDGSTKKHEMVLKLGFNLALAKTRRGGGVCGDPSIHQAFQDFRDAHPDHGWVHQLLAAWEWDCNNDFDKGLALYKKSCSLGHQPACEQVQYTESCQCKGKVDGR